MTCSGSSPQKSSRPRASPAVALVAWLRPHREVLVLHLRQGVAGVTREFEDCLERCRDFAGIVRRHRPIGPSGCRKLVEPRGGEAEDLALPRFRQLGIVIAVTDLFGD